MYLFCWGDIQRKKMERVDTETSVMHCTQQPKDLDWHSVRSSVCCNLFALCWRFSVAFSSVMLLLDDTAENNADYVSFHISVAVFEQTHGYWEKQGGADKVIHTCVHVSSVDSFHYGDNTVVVCSVLTLQYWRAQTCLLVALVSFFCFCFVCPRVCFEKRNVRPQEYSW